MLKAYSSIPERLHLVITGETGKALSLVIERDRAAAVLGGLVLLLVLLAAGTWMGAHFLLERNALATKAGGQAKELQSVHAGFADQLAAALAGREKEWQEQAAAYQTLVSRLQAEQGQFSAEQKQLICRYEEELAALAQASSAKTAALLSELAQARQDKQKLIEQTAGRLDERSRMIETMMSEIGIELKVGKKTADSSGGPFLAAAVDRKFSEQLLERSDRYIKAIQQMPLGLPMQGRITSRFGLRSDPFNNQPAFHAGIDFKGSIGDNVTATADGIVKETGYDQNGYGSYVIIQHGSGYQTLFGHLSAAAVKRGNTVRRGDVVGQMGSSGRSTGPHLHYEVQYQGKAVDPEKYLSVADLSFTVPM